MVDRQIIDEWLAKAEDDFRFAEMVLSEEKEYYNQICFHFQQSAEKYLKSFIIANNLGFEKTHDFQYDPIFRRQQDHEFLSRRF